MNAIHTKAANGGSPQPDVPTDGSLRDAYQYQRAYRLTIDLKDTIYVFTSEQIKQIQEHNVLVYVFQMHISTHARTNISPSLRSQRASGTAQAISNALSTSYGAASAKVHALSDTMLTELHHLQTSAAQLPAQAQASLGGLTERVGTVIGDIKEVVAADAPVSDKLTRLREAVEHQVQPLLAGASARVQEVVGAVRAKTTKSAPGSPEPNGVANGNGTAH